MNINPNKAFQLHYQIACFALFKNNWEPTCIIPISIGIKYSINIIQTPPLFTYKLHLPDYWHTAHLQEHFQAHGTAMYQAIEKNCFTVGEPYHQSCSYNTIQSFDVLLCCWWHPCARKCTVVSDDTVTWRSRLPDGVLKIFLNTLFEYTSVQTMPYLTNSKDAFCANPQMLPSCHKIGFFLTVL